MPKGRSPARPHWGVQEAVSLRHQLKSCPAKAKHDNSAETAGPRLAVEGRPMQGHMSREGRALDYRGNANLADRRLSSANSDRGQRSRCSPAYSSGRFRLVGTASGIASPINKSDG